MRKRQFGSGRPILANDHNLAQNYAEWNIREVAADGGILGIISGGSLTPHQTLQHTVVTDAIIARTSTGERLVIPASTNVFTKPSVDPMSGNEIWMTIYALYDYQLTEADTDEYSAAYYKDYQNSYSIHLLQGSVNTTGNSVKPTIPANAILLCDILYDTTLYGTGALQQSDINITRQDNFSNQSIINLIVSGTSELRGAVTIKSGADFTGTYLSNVGSPVSGNQVGTRDYNDSRYVNIDGDTMTGALVVPDLTITGSLSLSDLTATGHLIVDDTAVFNSSVTVANASLSVNNGSISVGNNITALNKITAKGLVFPWATGKAYTIGEVVYETNTIYKCTTNHTSTTFLSDITNWVSIGGGGGTTHQVHQVSHGFVVGNVLRYAGTYVKAQANSVSTLGLFVVIQVLDSDNFVLSSGGYFEDLTYTVNFTASTWYYLSSTGAGLLTNVQPAISNPILFAVDTNKAYVFPYRPEVGASMHLKEYVANTGQTSFSIDYQPITSEYLTVSIDGIVQSSSAYSIVSSSGIVYVLLSEPMLGGEQIRIQTVYNMIAQPGASVYSDEFTVGETSTGKTQFTLTFTPINANYVIVSIDGAIQYGDAFTLNQNIITFAEGLDAGNRVRVLHIRNLNLQFTVTDSIGDVELYRNKRDIIQNRYLSSGIDYLSFGLMNVPSSFTVSVPTDCVWTIL